MKIEVETISKKIKNIINEWFSIDSEYIHFGYNEKLQIILSESTQALSFVTTIEDEFDLEFDDDEVDLDFFMDLNIIIERIKAHNTKK